MTSLKSLLVDPPLFTAPYDAALNDGLEASGIDPLWATRSLRANEAEEIPATHMCPIFYPLTDGARRERGRKLRWLKGVEHVIGLRRTERMSRRGFDVVHFQWSVLPRLDIMAIRAMRRRLPVILTVHDIVPFNGKAVSPMQRSGLDDVMHAVDAVIVHTAGARQTLLDKGMDAGKVRVVPHGPLPLNGSGEESRRPGLWRIVMFGRLQDYKGLDVLIEAAALIDPATRVRIEIVVAGEPMVDLAPLRARGEALGVNALFDLRPGRLSDDAMAALLRSADAFVFPYRAIEASGVLFLVAHLGKWMIASDLGAFRTLIDPGVNGALVPPGDATALADALRLSVGQQPAAPPRGIPDWQTIGAMTRALYEEVIHDRKLAA